LYRNVWPVCHCVLFLPRTCARLMADEEIVIGPRSRGLAPGALLGSAATDLAVPGVGFGSTDRTRFDPPEALGGQVQRLRRACQ